MEYLTGLVVSLAILLMGVEMGKSSLEKICSPEVPTFSWLAVVILCRRPSWSSCGCSSSTGPLAARIGSAGHGGHRSRLPLRLRLHRGRSAVHPDRSLPRHAQVDGLAGLLVAVFILKTGWEAARDTLDPLLGRPMDPELAADIDQLVLSHPNILGIHDLVYHDYGPGRAMMSFHAEVPADCDLLEIHDISRPHRAGAEGAPPHRDRHPHGPGGQ